MTAIKQKYDGIQFEYALVLRQLQITIYQKKPNPKKHTIRDIQQMSDVLLYMNSHGVCDKSDFEKRVSELTAEQKEKVTKLSDLKSDIEKYKKTCEDYIIYRGLEEKINKSMGENPFTEDDDHEYIRTNYCRKYSYEDIARMKIKIANSGDEIKALSDEVDKLTEDVKQASIMGATYDRQMTDIYSTVLEQVKAEQLEREREEILEIQKPVFDYKDIQENLVVNKSRSGYER